MYSDNDIKIVGDKPSRDVKRNKEAQSGVNGPDKATAEKARNWGKTVALEFIADVKNATELEENSDYEMLLQRRLLLSFTATVGFEQFVKDDAVSGIAQKSFIDTVNAADSAHAVAVLEGSQHFLNLLVLLALGTDQHEVEDREHQNEGEQGADQSAGSAHSAHFTSGFSANSSAGIGQSQKQFIHSQVPLSKSQCANYSKYVPKVQGEKYE